MDARKVSIISALAASSCCLPPLILLGLTLLGIGTAGLAGLSSTLGSLKIYLLPLAWIGVSSSYYLYFREKKKCVTSSCQMANKKFTQTMLTISTVVVLGFTTWSVYPYLPGYETEMQPINTGSAKFAVFEVEGMTCGGCEIAVTGALQATGLVDSARSSFTESRAYVWYGSEKLETDSLLKAISAVGYNSTLVEVDEQQNED